MSIDFYSLTSSFTKFRSLFVATFFCGQRKCSTYRYRVFNIRLHSINCICSCVYFWWRRCQRYQQRKFPIDMCWERLYAPFRVILNRIMQSSHEIEFEIHSRPAARQMWFGNGNLLKSRISISIDASNKVNHVRIGIRQFTCSVCTRFTDFAIQCEYNSMWYLQISMLNIWQLFCRAYWSVLTRTWGYNFSMLILSVHSNWFHFLFTFAGACCLLYLVCDWNRNLIMHTFLSIGCFEN